MLVRAEREAAEEAEKEGLTELGSLQFTQSCWTWAAGRRKGQRGKRKRKKMRMKLRNKRQLGYFMASKPLKVRGGPTAEQWLERRALTGLRNC